MAIGLDIVKIIKYEGDNNELVWKHPAEDFNTGSQLIVHESQEAILFKNGHALDLFGPGRHTLSTENIPLLRRITSIPTNGESPFHCEVYYINKVDIMDVYWGTAQPIPIQDPVYNIILPVRANGQFAMHVADSRKLLTKLVGTTTNLTKDKASELFKGILLTRVQNLLSDMMAVRQISFLMINSYLNEISDSIKSQVAPLYDEYGMEIVNFFVNSISVPSDDPGYIKIRNALASAKEKELSAKGTRAEMDILGYSYQEKRTFDVLDKAASNEGAGAGILVASMGMGMGVNVGGMIGGAMAGAMSNTMQGQLQQNNPAPVEEAAGEAECPSCGTRLPGRAKFCFNCGLKLGGDICPGCGKPIIAGAKFCLECGRQL
ncbi:SPFH domain-containing protein [Butyrivibrio sp.]|uniref:SPFH domain-containing protein n=1 Tax=Butyrivibrio sp. TaxID=28121 RepID=UPI0025C03D18|nr:SPFH domain-containing protein [Butyrivibrio sp.]MBQ9304136.1 SPFH domain-containing protein [Butyrivibrio sp.]